MLECVGMDDRLVDARRARLAWLAADVLGDHGVADAWLGSPLTELAGRTPLEAASTPAGCSRVAALLLALAERHTRLGEAPQ